MSKKLKYGRTTKEPPRLIIYGEPGIGKSSLIEGFSEPLVIPTERGLAEIDVDATPIPETWKDFKALLLQIKKEPHDYNTLVVDVVNKLEPMIQTYAAGVHGVSAIGDVKWGRGYQTATGQWAWLRKTLTEINEDRKMVILLIGHSRVDTVEMPDSDPYQSFDLDIQRDIDRRELRRWCDGMLFYRYKTKVERLDASFGAVKTKASGDGERALYTQKRPAFQAKCRYKGVPFEIDVEEGGHLDVWPRLKEYIKNGG